MVGALLLQLPLEVAGQAPPVPAVADSATAASPAMAAAQASAPPVGIVLGIGWGMRQDDCIGCAEAANTDSFSGHLSITRPLLAGVGVGLDASVWQRGHPAPAGAVRPDDGGGDAGDGADPPGLTNRLANLSVVFSYQAGVLYLRGGVGGAFGWADMVEDDGNGGGIIATASGKGVGFTAGGGLLLPVAGKLGLAFYANWNYGTYDLTSPTAVVARDVTHEYLELGVGIAFR